MYEPKTQFVRDIITRLTERFPAATFGGDGGFDDGIFYAEVFRGNVAYLFERNTIRGIGTTFYVDDGGDTLGSYRCTYFDSFETAFADFLTLTEDVLPESSKA